MHRHHVFAVPGIAFDSVRSRAVFFAVRLLKLRGCYD